MLSHRSIFASVAFGTALLASGCTIKATETSNTVGGGAGGGYTTTTSTTTTTTTSSGAGGMGAGGMGAGGQPECLGTQGSGQTEAVCDDSTKTPIAAATAVCDDQGGVSGSNPPPGIGACHGGFRLWVAGAAEELWYCLAQIGVEPANACDLEQVSNCVGKVSALSCTDASSSVCGQLKAYCPQGDATFDEPSCVVDIAPWQDQPMVDLGDCMTTALAAVPAPTCQEAYVACFDQITGN